mmetsp:Transcript_22858/g.64922  ORF Transcript_22858/g.64922 Transcript_22858/m.64922 type:complete len:443 (+) Transcript_22858:296-1624(+)
MPPDAFLAPPALRRPPCLASLNLRLRDRRRPSSDSRSESSLSPRPRTEPSSSSSSSSPPLRPNPLLPDPPRSSTNESSPNLSSMLVPMMLSNCSSSSRRTSEAATTPLAPTLVPCSSDFPPSPASDPSSAGTCALDSSRARSDRLPVLSPRPRPAEPRRPRSAPRDPRSSREAALGWLPSLASLPCERAPDEDGERLGYRKSWERDRERPRSALPPRRLVSRQRGPSSQPRRPRRPLPSSCCSPSKSLDDSERSLPARDLRRRSSSSRPRPDCRPCRGLPVVGRRGAWLSRGQHRRCACHCHHRACRCWCLRGSSPAARLRPDLGSAIAAAVAANSNAAGGRGRGANPSTNSDVNAEVNKLSGLRVHVHPPPLSHCRERYTYVCLAGPNQSWAADPNRQKELEEDTNFGCVTRHADVACGWRDVNPRAPTQPCASEGSYAYA